MEEWILSDDLRESYDKEWALKDEFLRTCYQERKEECLEQKEKEIVINMFNKDLSIEEISNLTNISIDKINIIIQDK